MTKDVKAISIRVSDGLLKQIDNLIETGEFRSRSDVILYATRFYFDYKEIDEKKN